MTPSGSSQATEFAQVHGHPGEGARAWAIWHAWLPVALLLFAMGFAAGSALRPAWLRDGVAGFALMALALALTLSLRRARGRVARHREGALGESRVAEALSRLPASHHVFHGYPFAGTGRGGGRDLDHVVVGPTGCFLVETKNWPAPLQILEGRLVSEGRSYPGAGLAEWAGIATRFSDHLREGSGLRVDVTPVICLAKGRIDGMPLHASGVWICGPDQITSLIRGGEGNALPDALLDRLAGRLAESYKATKE